MDAHPETIKFSKVQDIGNTYANTTTGGVTLLNNIIIGADYNNRIGRVIEMKAMRLRFRCHPVGTVSDYQNLRVLLVYDFQTNGGTPTILDILQSSSTLSNENYLTRTRFLIFKDWLFHQPRYDIQNPLVAGQACFQDSSFITIDEYIPLNLKTVYSSSAGTAITTGGLFLVTLGTSPVFGTVVAFTNRIYYNDD